MPFVIDGTIAACWLLSDTGHDTVEAALARLTHDDVRVPPVWRTELRDLLLRCERDRQIDEGETAAALALLDALPIAVAPLSDDAAVLALARRHRLTAAAAAYVALAAHEGLPLATLDADLAAAARRERVPLIGEDAP